MVISAGAVIAALFLMTHSSTRVQSSGRLIGTWKLVSASATSDGESRDNIPFGQNPTGLLIYTPEGTMAAFISHGGRKPLSAGDAILVPLEERAEAYATFIAYAGRYTDAGDRVIHHVEAASFQNWVDSNLVRLVKVDNNRITLTTPPTSSGGKMRTFELVWDRVDTDK